MKIFNQNVPFAIVINFTFACPVAKINEPDLVFG